MTTLGISVLGDTTLGGFSRRNRVSDIHDPSYRNGEEKGKEERVTLKSLRKVRFQFIRANSREQLNKLR